MKDLIKSPLNVNSPLVSARRIELDWLRVATVMLVFLHHAGMPFNGDTWHIMNGQSSKLLDDIMVYFEQWRLPLLLLISGAGTVMAFSKRSTLQFVKERSLRLIIPLIFGALVIIPPQTYFQFINRYHSYSDIYPEALINVHTNHLWFIEFLFVFSILCIPLVLFLRSDRSTSVKQRIESWCSGSWGLLLFAIPLIVLRVITKIYYPENDHEIAYLSTSLYYLYFFVVGIILFSCKGLWSNLKRYRKINSIAALISLCLFYSYYYFPDEIISSYVSIPTRWKIWWAVSSLVGWATMLTVIGYAQVYLTKSHRWLPRLNEAVYPFYILHQTVIVALAYYVVQWQVSITVKLPVLVLFSFISIALIYRILIYPFKLTRFLFGMKPKK